MLTIALTEAWDPGSADPGQTYDRCAIVECYINPIMGYIKLSHQYGYFVGEQFFPGPAVTAKQAQISGEDYAAVALAASGDAGEEYFQEVLRRILQWLIDQGHVQGTIS